MKPWIGLFFVAAVGLLGGACVSAVDSSRGRELDDVAPLMAAGSRAAPTEAELCAIVFGVAGRGDVEGELGEPDATRETVDRVVLLYEYDDGVTIALHLDADVFRDFSLYGARIPPCWAQAKRMVTEWPRITDAGAADSQTQ